MHHPSLSLAKRLPVVIGCLLAAQGRSVAQPCTVSGRDVSLEGPVTVTPRSGSAFEVNVVGARVEARVPVHGTAILLNLRGALSFRGQVQELDFTIAKTTPAEQGMVRLLPGARLVNARRSGGAVLATAILYSGDGNIAGAPADEVVQAVRVPCAKLTLDAVEASAELEPCTAAGDQTWWQVSNHPEHLELRARPSADAAAISVRAASCAGAAPCMQFERIQERGAWMKVRRHGEHVCVAGWVLRAELAPVPAAAAGESHDYLPPARSTDETGEMVYVDGAEASSYHGPARIKVGTVVHECSVEGGPWATVAKADGFEVHFVRGERWARLVEVPGLAGAELSACVPVASLVLPKAR